MARLHFTKGFTVNDLFGFEVVPGANPSKTVLRRKGDEENASYVLLDGVQPDVYHAFVHAVQAAGEACQWTNMENYVRFGLAGEQDRPAREVLDEWTKSRDTFDWLVSEADMNRAEVREAAENIESFGVLFEAEYERLNELAKHAPKSAVVNVMSGEEAEVAAFDPENLCYEVRTEEGTTSHWDADTVEAREEVHVAPPHAEFYMDKAGWFHTFVLAGNDEVLFCSRLPGEGYAWEYATALAKDPDAWRGWDNDWGQEAGSDVVEDLGSCRDLASGRQNQVVAWEPYIDPLQHVDFWKNEAGRYVGFAPVSYRSALATHELHLTYDIEEGVFRGDEIGPDGWVDLDVETASKVASKQGFDRFVEELEGRFDLIAEKKGGMCAGEVLKQLDMGRLESARRISAKRVPSKGPRTLDPEAVEKAARAQTSEASTKDAHAKSQGRR